MKGYEPYLNKIMLDQAAMKDQLLHAIEMLQWLMGYISGVEDCFNHEEAGALLQQRQPQQQQPKE